MAEDFEVQISADVSGLTSAFSEAQQSGEELKSGLEGIGEASGGAGEGFGELKEQIDSATEALGKMTGGWEGLLGVIGGGAIAELMHHIAETTIEVGRSVANTSAALGVSANDARGFNEAMSSVNISSQIAARAIGRLEVDAANGGKKLAELGISARQANGDFKSGIAIFEEVISHLQGLTSANERAAAAAAIFGIRYKDDILRALNEIKPAIKEASEDQKANTEINKLAESAMYGLSKELTVLHSAWENGIIQMAPLVEASLGAIAAALEVVTSTAIACAQAIAGVFAMAGKLGAGLSKIPAAFGGTGGGPEGFSTDPDAIKNNAKALTELGDAGQAAGDAVKKTWDDVNKTFKDSDARIKVILDRTREITSQSNLHEAEGAIPGHFTPPSHGGGGGRHKKGGGGGADPMAGLDESLDLSKDEMDKMSKQFEKLGSEATMAAKEGGKSFEQLANDATADYQKMQAKYKEFTDAVQSGNKQAAESTKKEWKQAAQDFEKDWKEAQTKAQADMQQFKSMADSMANEVSGILNQAISGKLNWVQEMDKILSQMVSNLTKRLAEMVADWVLASAQQRGAQESGFSGILSAMGRFFAQGLAMLFASKGSQIAADAAVGAAGAYASSANIPWIGWAVAPGIAAEAEASILSFAEKGFDVPPGVNPITQLHQNEMVLPAPLAENVRRGMGAGGGGAAHNTLNMNVSALDSRSVAEMFRSNPDVIAQAAAAFMRSGGQLNTG